MSSFNAYHSCVPYRNNGSTCTERFPMYPSQLFPVNAIAHVLQTTLKAFKKADFTTVRDHEEFVWLHDRFVENEDYAGLIVSSWGIIIVGVILLIQGGS